jgi:hypothetical protein
VVLKELIDTTIRGYLYRVLSESKTIKQAARKTGITRQNFYKLLRRYGIYAGKMKRGPEEGPGCTKFPGGNQHTKIYPPSP